MSIDRRGVVGGWVNAQDWASWDFKVFQPGTFEVVAVTAPGARGATWDGGHKVTVEVAGSKLEATMTRDGEQVDPSNPHTRFFVSKLGRVALEKAGPYQLSLKLLSIEAQMKGGLTLAMLKLVPVK
jgi:alpha-L-fucosidase